MKPSLEAGSVCAAITALIAAFLAASARAATTTTPPSAPTSTAPAAAAPATPGAGTGSAATATPAPAGPGAALAAAGVVKSTYTPQSIYTAERVRDPFTTPTSIGGSGDSQNPFTMDDFSIHNLTLRAIMKDSTADFALFGDAQFGVTFILRKGKLLDPRGKPIKGVTGGLNIKQRTAHLMAADGDVQTFKLGQDEEEEEAQ